MKPRPTAWRLQLEPLEDRLAPALIGPLFPSLPSDFFTSGLFAFTRQVVDYQLSAPAAVKRGATFTLHVRPVDLLGNVRPLGLGRVSFSSDDPAASLPGVTTLDRTRDTFEFSFTLRTAGRRTITLTELDGSPIRRSIVIDVRALVAAAKAAPVPSFAFAGEQLQASVIANAPVAGQVPSASSGTLLFFRGPVGVGDPPTGGQTSSGRESGAPAQPLASRLGGEVAPLLALLTATPLRTTRASTLTAGRSGEGAVAGPGQAITGGLVGGREGLGRRLELALWASEEALDEVFRHLPVPANQVIGIGTSTTAPSLAHVEEVFSSPQATPTEAHQAQQEEWAPADAAFLTPIEACKADDEGEVQGLALGALGLGLIQGRRERKKVH